MSEASEFDRATAIRPGAADGRFDVDIDAGWTVGPKPNGGYLLALAGRAAGQVAVDAGAPHRDPLAATAHYLRAPDVGPADVTAEVLRLGRTASQVRTVLRQADEACVEATITLGELDESAAPPWWNGLDPVALPAIEDCVPLPSARPGAEFTVAIMDRCDVRLDPAVLGFAAGAPGGSGEVRGWTCFTDGRPVDPLALLFFVDAFPPATFELATTGWVPTLSLSAYVRARPAPGPLRISQRAQVVAEARVDEVCEVWDCADQLVAQATQLAGIRIEPGTEPPPRP
ncbi:MAG: thioesterase family protein [Acidimicrobiales bacterium]